jgi:N-acetylglucosaminyl-diphospho-decaprenol L-rhamnosyltransferase
MVSARFPEVVLHRSSENRGFGAANNILAMQSDADYIVLLNPDTVWRSDVLTPLIAALDADPDAVLAAPRLVYPDGRLQLSSQRLPSLRFEFAHAIRGSKLTRLPGLRGSEQLVDSVQQVHAATRDGAVTAEFVWATCWALRGDWVRDNGLFDERYPLYDEDLDFCARLRDAGRHALYVPGVTLLHIGGASSDPERKRRLMTQARTRYYRIRCGSLTALVYAAAIVPISRYRNRS